MLLDCVASYREVTRTTTSYHLRNCVKVEETMQYFYAALCCTVPNAVCSPLLMDWTLLMDMLLLAIFFYMHIATIANTTRENARKDDTKIY